MKFTILKEKLKEGIGVVERIASKSGTLPILNNISIRTEKNFLKLAATDLEIGVSWWALIKSEKEGAAVLPTRIFSSLINFFPNKPVTISTKDLIVDIKCDNHQSSLKSLNPDDYPIIPSITEAESLTLPAASFCQNLQQVTDLAAVSSSKPEISGIYFVFQKNLMKMVATDSFRLGEKTVFFSPEKNLSKNYNLILPQSSARELINVFGEKEGELKIYFSPNHILFESLMLETKHPQIRFISRLIEGEFPNYEEIIPRKWETQIIISRKEFLNQVKSASVFSGRVNEIKLKTDLQKRETEIFSQSPDVGEYQSRLPAAIKGKDLEISFNHKFLIDGLSKIKSPEVVLELTSEEGPGVLKPTDDSSYIYILMPIKKS
jgi:DNA polymerase-3 subunit beta